MLRGPRRGPQTEQVISRRMERAAALQRTTAYPVADICKRVGLRGVGSFTTSFGRAYRLSATA